MAILGGVFPLVMLFGGGALVWLAFSRGPRSAWVRERNGQEAAKARAKGLKVQPSYWTEWVFASRGRCLIVAAVYFLFGLVWLRDLWR